MHAGWKQLGVFLRDASKYHDAPANFFGEGCVLSTQSTHHYVGECGPCSIIRVSGGGSIARTPPQPIVSSEFDQAIVGAAITDSE